MTCAMKREAWTWYIYQVIWYLQKSFVRGVNHVLSMFVSIILVCKPGFYNSTSHCTSKCGHCKDNTTCDNESGQCPDGCEQHFKEPFCQGSLKYRMSKLRIVLEHRHRCRCKTYTRVHVFAELTFLFILFICIYK